MSKVKFIQLSAISKADYDKKLADAQSSYPGAIIFVTYTDDTNNNKQKQEIWANGKKYEVGGGAGNVIYGDEPVNANGQVVLEKDGSGNPVSVQTGEEGSIYVYKGVTSQTAYYWSAEGKWEPFNVDAENVWFPNGFRRTEAWGVIGATGGTVKNDIKPGVGESPKNLIQVFEHYLVKPAFPSNVQVTCANPSPTFTAKYMNSTPVTISATKGSTNLSNNDYVLVGTSISLDAIYNYAMSVDAHTTSLTFGPMTISGMEYGYTASDSRNNEIKSEDTIITGTPVTITSTLGSLQVGTATFDITKSGISVGTNTQDTTNSTSKQNTCKRSDVLQLGDNVYTATGSTTDELTRTLSPAISNNQVEVSPISYTNVKYWNNKKDDQEDVPTSGINPYNNKKLSVNYSTTAGVDKVDASITIKGYLPIYYGLITSATTSISSLTGLNEKTGSEGYTDTTKTITITPSSEQSSSGYTPYIVVPSTCSISSCKYGQFTFTHVEDNTKLTVKDGSNKDIKYTSYLIKGDWAPGNTFTITFN